MRKITYLGAMPDPFRKEDGTMMTREEWYAQREALRDFMDRARAGLPLSEHLQINPYPQIEKNFDWE